MRFLAYDLTLDLIRGLQAPLAIVRRHNAAPGRGPTPSTACS